MLPVVVVDLPEAPAELKAKALEGCSAALADGVCVERSAEAPKGRYTAIIRWTTSDQRELLLVFHGDRASVPGSERRVTFAPEDDLESRWAAAGLLVATLVTEDRAARSATPEPPQQPAPPPAPAPLPPPSRASTRFELGALATLGPSPLEGARLGAELGAWAARTNLPLFVTGSVRFAGVTGGEALHALTASGGFGARVGAWTEPLALELRSEVLWERLTLRASADGETESASADRLGARLALTGVFTLHASYSLLAGADVSLLRPEVTLRVRDRQIGVEPATRVAFHAGVRFSP